MSEVLVLVDHVEGEIKKATFELLTAARALGEPSAVVVGAPNTAGKLVDALREHGAEKIYVAESDSTDFLTPQVGVLAALVERIDPVAVLIATSADGKEIAGRLAVRTGSAWLNDVVAVAPDGVTHSVFGGAWTARATAKTAHPVVTLRPGSVEPSQAAGAGAQETVDVPASDRSATVVSREPLPKGDRPDLSDASVVVSGGRGVGSAEQFSVVAAPLKKTRRRRHPHLRPRQRQRRPRIRSRSAPLHDKRRLRDQASAADRSARPPCRATPA